jgi:hypothetical protein
MSDPRRVVPAEDEECQCPPSHNHTQPGKCHFKRKARTKEGFLGSECLCLVPAKSIFEKWERVLKKVY